MKSSKSGIKARAARGLTPLSSWWAKKWMSVVENCVDEDLLTKGKVYAKRGQVASIEIEAGLVTAFVQGTRAMPYQIRLGFETVTDNAKRLIVMRMREHAYFAANLLVQKMPGEMEEVFSDAGAPFFPTKAALRRYKCTCDSDTAPCKHIVAVLLLLAEVIDDNPFLLLKLRGIEREELIDLLTRETNDQDYDPSEYDEEDECDEGTISGGADEEITETQLQEENFDMSNWYGSALAGLTFEIEDKEKSSSALDIMNDFPFWRGEASFRKTLLPYYERVFNIAYELLLGEKKVSAGRPKKLL